MKGTDQLEPLFDRLAAQHPDTVSLTKVISVPFAEYLRLVSEADVVIDQLYSYTPAMGAIESLSQGKVVVSGYETEYARFESEASVILTGDVTPESLAYVSGIINLRPFADADNYALLERLLTDRAVVERLQQAARRYVRQHHDADRVAARYLDVWSSAIGVGDESSSSSRSSQR